MCVVVIKHSNVILAINCDALHIVYLLAIAAPFDFKESIPDAIARRISSTSKKHGRYVEI